MQRTMTGVRLSVPEWLQTDDGFLSRVQSIKLDHTLVLVATQCDARIDSDSILALSTLRPCIWS